MTTPDNIEILVKDGKLFPNTRIDFVRSYVGVAVRAGAPKPDISTAEAFKTAMLAAKKVGISKGPSGQYLMTVLQKLGIADAVKAKAVIPPLSVRVGTLVAKGEAEIGVQQVNELLPIPDRLRLLLKQCKPSSSIRWRGHLKRPAMASSGSW